MTCVQDCHGEGQRGGLKLRREQEGCHYLMAAKSQLVHCCCSVSVWLVQTHSTSAASAVGRGGLSEAGFSTSLKSLQASPLQKDRKG